eukprot:TRINITY_DN74386_c0_g1_i1.p2 TRINITY_DN74386_c0_g1~~TRINITY_DN74386_c0_g1_i1.p2  ORF type:complete len:141 (-),score=3.15 TRINITY_DN74386_c0_g1_i1:508-930(-)
MSCMFSDEARPTRMPHVRVPPYTRSKREVRSPTEPLTCSTLESAAHHHVTRCFLQCPTGLSKYPRTLDTEAGVANFRVDLASAASFDLVPVAAAPGAKPCICAKMASARGFRSRLAGCCTTPLPDAPCSSAACRGTSVAW